jgi:hypothetical protein
MKRWRMIPRRPGLVLLLLIYVNCTGETTEPAVATAIVANSETSISGVAGAAVSPAPSVIVRDQNGNPMGGAPVTFAVVSGGGSVTGPTVTSNASGVATVGAWTLGATAGANVLTASLDSLTVTFNATGAVGPAASLTKSAGDGQVATAGSTVPVAPSVIVKDANGNVKSGVVVTFDEGVGGGSVTGETATSNASGVATVGSWTLGTSSGTYTLVASAAGVPSVTFNAAATATAPPPPPPPPLQCGVTANHTFGTVSSGTLSTTDCQLSDGSFIDLFTTTVPTAGAYLFRQGAPFDTYLLLAFPDGTTIAENDDASETGTGSGIKALLPAGSYLLGPGSLNPGVTGDYEISSITTFTNVGNCELVFAVKGISTDQNIEATDCLWTTPPAAPIYADAIFIFLKAGQSVTLNMTSSAVDSYLELVRVDGVSVAQNDNKDATTKDAQITFTAVQTNYYAIFTRTAVASQTGAYTLTIQ